MGRGQGHSSTDVNQVRRPFRDRARLWTGPTRVSGGRAQEGPSRTWATEEEVGKKVNSKIINKGEGRGKRNTFLIYRLYFKCDFNLILSEIGLSKREKEKM